MAVIRKMYLGGIKSRMFSTDNGHVETRYEWIYDSFDVKETPKRYQAIDDVEFVPIHKGMIFPKEYIDSMGNQIIYMGHLTVNDNGEDAMKEIIRQKIYDKIAYYKNRLNQVTRRSKRLEEQLENTKRLLDVIPD